MRVNYILWNAPLEKYIRNTKMLTARLYQSNVTLRSQHSCSRSTLVTSPWPDTIVSVFCLLGQNLTPTIQFTLDNLSDK